MKRYKKKNNQGFSLIELIVSIVMLAIITVPLLSYFTSAAGYNARAKTRQNAEVLSQSIIEKCRDKSIEEIARSFHTDTAEFNNKFDLVPIEAIDRDQSRIEEVDASGNPITGSGSYNISENLFVNSANGLLYYFIRDIKQNGYAYDAFITIDSNINDRATYYDTNVNKTLYQIRAIQSPNNIVAVETTQNARASIAMSDLNRSYCDQENAAHAGNSGWTYKVPVSEAAIQSALIRNIYIDIDPSAGNVSQAKVKIYYKYYCPGIEGCPQSQSSSLETDPPLYQEPAGLEEMKNIYVFFQRNKDVEQIILDIDSGVAENINFKKKLDLYLLCQAPEHSNNAVPVYSASINPVGNSYGKVAAVYSNADQVSKNNDGSNVKVAGGYIGSEAGLRMMNIRVDVYRAGHLLDPKFLEASLTSTKGD